MDHLRRTGELVCMDLCRITMVHHHNRNTGWCAVFQAGIDITEPVW